MRRILFILLSLFSIQTSVLASGRIKHQSFYYSVDLNYGNLYSFAASSCLTGLLNYWIGMPLFINGYAYEIPNFSSDKLTYSNYSTVGVQARDLSNNINPGVRIGYRSEYFGAFNWGIYATCHYNYKQYSISEDITQVLNRISEHWIQPGACIRFAFGKITGNTAAILDVGVKYSFPMKYQGIYGNDLTQLNSGFISHIAASVGGHRFLQNISLFVDIWHFNVLNKSFVADDESPYEGIKYKPIMIGLSWTITKGQANLKR